MKFPLVARSALDQARSEIDFLRERLAFLEDRLDRRERFAQGMPELARQPRPAKPEMPIDFRDWLSGWGTDATRRDRLRAYNVLIADGKSARDAADLVMASRNPLDTEP